MQHSTRPCPAPLALLLAAALALLASCAGEDEAPAHAQAVEPELTDPEEYAGESEGPGYWGEPRESAGEGEGEWTGAEPVTEPEVEPEPTEREAALTIYCQREMVEGVQYDIAAFVSTALDRAGLRDVMVREAVASHEGLDAATAERNTSDYRVTVADRVRVDLELPTDQFELVREPAQPERTLSGEVTEDWHWTVIPRTTEDQTLVFRVSRWDEVNDRWKQVGGTQTFDVKVRVNFDAMTASTWGFLRENPEYLLSQILIPVVAYFFGRRRGKRDDEQAPAAT